MQPGAVIIESAMLAAAALQPLMAQDAPVADMAAGLPDDVLTTIPEGELTADLLLARKIEARCRNIRLSPETEDAIDRRGGALADYLNERRFGPSEARRPAIAAFEARHGTTYDGTNSLCRAGYLEMKEGTAIGRLLQGK